MLCELQLRLLSVIILWLYASCSNAAHLNDFNPRINGKQNTKFSKLKTQSAAVQIQHPTTQKNETSTKTTPGGQIKPVSQLQLEIKELNRMHEQLQREILKGHDTAKEKLLQHIKAQIHLRRTQLKNQDISPRLQQNHQHTKHNESQIQIFERKQREDKQKLHALEPVQTTGKTKRISEAKSSLKPYNKQAQNSEQQVPHSQDLHQQQRQYQHFHPRPQGQQDPQQQHLRQQEHQSLLGEHPDLQRRQAKQLTDNNSEARNNLTLSSQHFSSQIPLITNVSAQLHLQQQTQNLKQQNSQLPMNDKFKHWQQQQYQAQKAIPQNVMQLQQLPANIQNPIHVQPGQMVSLSQPTLNQAIVHPNTQQILFPINAYPLNGVLPSQLLSNERIIVVEAINDQTGQLKAVRNLENIETLRKFSEKSTASSQTTTKLTTTLPTTTVTTTPSSSTTTTTTSMTPTRTTLPTPPTTYYYQEETTPVNLDVLKQEFYKGEIRRQKLEIRKLQLEIRALQRNEMATLTGSQGGENEDGPQQTRIRFRPRGGMPFPFF